MTDRVTALLEQGRKSVICTTVYMRNPTGLHQSRGMRKKYQDGIGSSGALGNQLELKAVLRKWQDSKANILYNRKKSSLVRSWLGLQVRR